jgi:glycosyltransferase involved in cell wall biosynthesis
MPKGISTCILMRDSAAYIERTLRVASASDEIVVIDTGSRDASPDIARNYTSNITVIPLTAREMDFSLLRNQLTWKAKYDMVFHVDSDEFFNTDVFTYLKETYDSIRGGVGVMRLAESYSPGFCDHDLLNMHKPRVYDRTCGYWEGKIHERIAGRCWNSAYEIKDLLWHRAFKYTEESLIEKVAFYGVVEANPSLDYNDREYWLKRFEQIYAAQKMVPDMKEYKFVMDLFEKYPWQTEGVVGG